MTDLWPNVLAALIYAALGIVIFLIAFIGMDRLMPGSFWKEIIEEHNTALAIVVAGMSIAISLVIASAIY